MFPFSFCVCPWYIIIYIFFFALSKIIFIPFSLLLQARIRAYFQPDNPHAYIQALRSIRGLTNQPSPSEIKGSNIRSKVTTFDEVRVRLYEPIIKKDDSLQPALIFIHGGGNALGSPGKSIRDDHSLQSWPLQLAVNRRWRDPQITKSLACSR